MKVLALVAMVGCGGWQKRDTALELGALGTISADWIQTRTITHDCMEMNSIMGSCGERMSPDHYFPITGLLHVGIAMALPPKWRMLFQGLTIGAEANQIWANVENGYSPVR